MSAQEKTMRVVETLLRLETWFHMNMFKSMEERGASFAFTDGFSTV